MACYSSIGEGIGIFSGLSNLGEVDTLYLCFFFYKKMDFGWKVDLKNESFN